MILAGFYVIATVSPGRAGWVGLILGVICCTFLVGLGLSPLVRPFRTEIDFRRRRAWFRQRTALLFHRHSEMSLDDADSVVLRFQPEKDKDYGRFFVLLGGVQGSDLPLYWSTSLSEARQAARHVGVACGLPLCDLTGGTATILDPDEVTKGYVDRLTAQGRVAELPPQIEGSGIRCQAQPDALQLTVPPPGLPSGLWWRAVWIAVPTGAAVVALLFWKGLTSRDHGLWDWRLLAAAGAVAAVVTVFQVFGRERRSRLRGYGLRVTRRGLDFEPFGPGSPKPFAIEAERLADLRLVRSDRARGIPGGGQDTPEFALMITTFGDSLVFGHGLTTIDLRWLKQAIDFGLTGRLAPEVTPHELRWQIQQAEAADSVATLRLAPRRLGLSWSAVGVLCLVAGVLTAVGYVRMLQSPPAESDPALRPLYEEMQSRIGVEVPPMQQKLLAAMTHGDEAAIRALCLESIKGGFVGWSEDRCRRAADHTVADCRDFMAAVDPATLVAIEPEPGSADTAMSSRDDLMVFSGWKATFGFRATGLDGRRHEVTFEAYGCGEWQIAASHRSP
jgi:hypothetical protein